ncbi:MAG: deoxyguanosinetriphosphate triphosphohydrolase [Chloroflexi bacterium]|nr:deoxyguanosinetriphosphate triphosphohydrolase [Chloroflexota bacterium]
MQLSSVRRRLEAWEEERLSPWAARSSQVSRDMPERPCDLRTAFQRDRDRIIHTNAFRRLKHKTQVFIAPPGDHYVTRLTHTLEVMQIGRTIARALMLNEDLVEAASLGHDLGHTPFGHLGEEVLDTLLTGGFRHSLQSLRVVERLEKSGKGLNLTRQVRDAIVAHSKPRGNFLEVDETEGLAPEAQVVRIADAVAYLNHDIGDAIRAGLLREEELPRESRELLGTRHSQRIDSMVRDVVTSSWAITEGGRPPIVGMSPPVAAAVFNLREFMFERVYVPAGSGEEAARARDMLEFLYEHLLTHPEQVPEVYWVHGDTRERVAADYISGMTDNFAVQTAEMLRPGVSGGVFLGRI